MDVSQITFTLVAGLVVTVITALINRGWWSSRVKVYVSLAVAVVLTVAAVVFQLFPQAWDAVAAAIAAVFGVAQAVYPVLKPLLKRLESATTGNTEISDGVEEFIDDLISWDEPTPLGDHEESETETARGKHALDSESEA